MPSGFLRYRSIRAYKYRLEEAFAWETKLKPRRTIQVGDGWLRLTGIETAQPGHICFKAGYAWDGASGPTIDTKNWMRASIVHDGFYQFLREGRLHDLGTHKEMRKYADQLMLRILLHDGMSTLRARIAYTSVRLFGGKAAQPRDPEPVLTAP